MSKLSTEDRKEIPARDFAFPEERKEPLENAAHVRNAIARFNQVQGVSETEKDAAWRRIEAAAKKVGVAVSEASRRDLNPSRAEKTEAS